MTGLAMKPPLLCTAVSVSYRSVKGWREAVVFAKA